MLNAQNAGARAVVIANNVAGGAFSDGGTDRKVKIPSAMVTQANGVTLKGQAGSNAVLKANANALQVDGDLDSDIVFHEYGHGLTWRMIGSMSGTFAGAIGIRTTPYATATKILSIWTANQVHTDGEIYAAAMWEVLDAYQDYGQTADKLMADFVDGMNFTPASPTPEKMRDGMLSSRELCPRADVVRGLSTRSGQSRPLP